MFALFDHGTPRGLAKHLAGHTVTLALQRGWQQLSNGRLLSAAEEAGFDVLVPPDKNMVNQQNLKGRKLAIVVLGQQQWPKLREHVGRVAEAVNAATPGSYTEVHIPHQVTSPCSHVYYLS